MKNKGKQKSINSDLESYFYLNLKLLWCMGLTLNFNNNGIKDTRLTKGIPTFVTNLIGVTTAVFQVQWIMEISGHDTNLVTQICSNFFSNITSICKGFRIATSIEVIDCVLRDIAIIWNQNLPAVESRDKVFKGIKNTLFFCKCYVGIVGGVIVAWGIPPFQKVLLHYLTREETNHTFDYSQRIFMVKYPFEINTNIRYLSVLLEEEFLLFGAALGWLSCDALFAQITSHVRLQLEILQHDLQRLINSENDEVILRKNLIFFVKRHRELLRICGVIENIFSPIIFTTMMISSANICVNVFELRESIMKSQYEDAVVHIFLLISIFLQIVVYCTFAESLTYATSSIADAVYNSRWAEKNYKFRLYLQMFILKSQHPFRCTAYGFFPIGHKQLASVFRGSMSYYMYLETTK